jgi:ubiquitin carboxyl-terminal hydrolase 2/21/ubiquitin carboxyl-terminal hydrolase 8
LIQQNKLPKIGLKNLGKSSYINSILQILRNIGAFANYFLNPEKISFLDNVKDIMPLSFAMKELYVNLYPKEKTNISIYEPIQILKVLYTINNNYSANKENNIIYVLNDILNSLHRELNTSNIYEEKFSYDKYNRNDCINKGITFFTKTNTSIIFDTLNWFSLRERRCIICNTNNFHFETYNSFKLDILSCYKYNKLNNINKSISIIDCLKCNTSKFIENFFCEKCGKHESTEVNFKIFSSPNIFLFLIDRGINFNGNNELFNIPFALEKSINLGDFIENKKAPFNYGLTGIASISLKDKKYVSWCKSPVNNKWYFFNDEKIQCIKLDSIIELNNNNNYIPCILVYKDIAIS